MRPFLPVLVLSAVIAASALVPAADLPDGFVEERIASGLDPTTMTFAPDGRLFVGEKAGRVWVIKNNAKLSTPFVDLRSTCDNYNERGLQSVAFDPNFATNKYVYVFYTYTTNKSITTASRNRVVRFTVNGDVGGSQTLILDLGQLSSAGNHNGGGMRFGKDGKLYIAQGDGASSGNASNNGNLLGKLLRINPDGGIPSDNPYYTAHTGNNRAIVAFGLRNPFTLAVQRTTGLLFVNDVGSAWEEIDRYNTGVAPVRTHYGWGGISGFSNGQTKPANYVEPVMAYKTGTDGNAICGGDFYNPASPGSNAFPASYTGKYFFTDYGAGGATTKWIKYMDPTKQGSLGTPNTFTTFATNIPHPIDVEVAADGTLWYIARGSQFSGGNGSTADGAVWKVRYTGNVQVAAKLGITQQPGSVGAGVAISPAIKVAIQTSGGATVTGSSATVTLGFGANPGGATLGGTLSVAAVNGIATFSNVTVSKAGTGYTLKATSGSLTSATTSAFNILGQVATPTITPGTGTFSGPVWVQLATATGGAAIRYTIDGTSPSGSSPLYSAPFQITSTRTVRAIALKSGLTTSATATSSITISGSTAYGLDYRPPLTGVAMPANVSGALPATLGATGLFTDVDSLVTKKALIPYTVNSPLWSDNAEKRRWVGLPGTAKIFFAPTGEYDWPGGTVFIKHFELVVNESTNAKKRLETRVLVLNSAGDGGYGVTYRWKSDNSDATLVGESGADEVITITQAGGGTRQQTWHYPSRAECLQCHATNAGFVLGPKTRQLNGTYAYPGGSSDNQVRTWRYLQMFSNAPAESSIGGYHKLVKVDDGSASLEKRVRSYLDANCANCHRPNGTPAVWDARFDTPLADQAIINGGVRDDLGLSSPFIVKPKDLAKSVMHIRMNATDSRKMPPLARNVVDRKAVDALEDWIASLPNGTGVRGQYWTNQLKTFTGSPTVTRTDPAINFAWGAAAPATGVTANNFTARWTGKLVPAYTETYRLFTESDDGVRLWINNQLVVDRWVPQSATEVEANKTFAFTAGQQYDLKMEYFEQGGDAVAKLRWSSPSLPKSIVPQYRLFPTTPALAALAFNSVAITPGDVTVVDGGSVAYEVVANDQNGDPLVPQPTFTWTVSGGGTITSDGVFTATIAGSHTVTATAADDAGMTASTSVTVTNPISARINFQPASAEVPSGYAADTGLVFAERGNGFSYGWNVDVSATARDRNTIGDQARDTLIHLQKSETPDAVWEIAVPNGTYEVLVVCGDAAANYNATYDLAVEGKPAVSGMPTSAMRFFDSGPGFRAIVSDGRLTISSGNGAVNNKICLIELVQIPVAIN